MVRTLYILLLTPFLFSCKSIGYDDFRSDYKVSRLLPPLETQVDLESYENAFPMISEFYMEPEHVALSLVTLALTDIDPSPLMPTKELLKENPKFYEAINFFERDVNTNITENYGEFRGAISSKISLITDRNVYGSELLTLTSILLLGLPNLFGMPAGGHYSAIELEVSIFDLSDNLVGRYTGYCNNREWIALYYGYDYIDASKLATINALKCAMDNVKQQIEADSGRIINLLYW